MINNPSLFLSILSRSILYYVDLGVMSSVIPIDLPVKIEIVDVSQQFVRSILL